MEEGRKLNIYQARTMSQALQVLSYVVSINEPSNNPLQLELL